MEAERMCCWDPPTRTGSVLLLTDSRVRETHCSADAWFGGILFTRRLRGLGGICECPGRERERGEGGSQQSPFSLRWVSLLFSFCLALFCQSKSPQIVLLCAGAFPQGYVVHGHLSAPASPALPLQDHLMNSSKMRHTEVFLHRNM